MKKLTGGQDDKKTYLGEIRKKSWGISSNEKVNR
jgi:hypothetical protein